MRSMTGWLTVAVSVLAGMALPSAGADATDATSRVGPEMQVVHRFGEDFRAVGIGVSHRGRVFVTAPSSQVRSRYSVVEVDPASGRVTPYPDAGWNVFSPTPGQRREWVSVQAMWVDEADHLWALDSSLPRYDQAVLPPKLVEFDLATNQPLRIYTFGTTVTPKDSLNDVRIDRVHGYAYLTNADNRGGLVVLDLASGRSRLVLVGDRSAVAAEGQHLLLGGHPALRHGRPAVIQTDGIALSPDARWLYYRPLTDHNYWRIPTSALIDQRLTPARLSAEVQYLGSDVLSGGLIMDRAGTLYGGDLEHHTVVALEMRRGRLHGRVFLRDRSLLSWADGFASADGWLYISDSHLNEVGFDNNLPRSGPFSILRARLPAGG